MRSLLLLLTSLALIGCSSPIPQTIIRPPESLPIVVEPLRKSTDRTAELVKDAFIIAREAADRVKEASDRANEAQELADEAYKTGLEQGSQRAKDLSEAVKRVNTRLAAITLQSEILENLLDESVAHANRSKERVRHFEIQIAKVESELAQYRAGFEEANKRLSQVSDIIKARQEAEIKLGQSRVWTRRWFFGFIGLSALVLVYIWARITSWKSWIR